MRGSEAASANLWSYVRQEERVPADHPLRPIRALADELLGGLNAHFEGLYSDLGRPSIPAGMLLRATLLQTFFSVRFERMVMDVLHPTVFTHNRDRLLETEVACAFLSGLLAHKPVKRLLSSEHFSVGRRPALAACGSPCRPDPEPAGEAADLA